MRHARARDAALLGALALAACAGPVKYAPRPEIALNPQSLALARDVSRKVEDRLALDGDFHPNDLVRLSFPYQPLLTADQRVQMSGFISPPLLPPVQTRGLTAAALQARLQALYRAKLERPEVSVAVIEYNRPPPVPEIFVVGEVARPGAYPYRDGTTPFEGLGRAGGAGRDADLARVVLMAPAGDHLEARLIDLSAVLHGSAASLDYLPPFAILIVPPRGLARDADRGRQIRQIIGFNGFTFGSSATIINP